MNKDGEFELFSDDRSEVVSEWRCMGCGNKLRFFGCRCDCGDKRVHSGTWCPLGCMMVMGRLSWEER